MMIYTVCATPVQLASCAFCRSSAETFTVILRRAFPSRDYQYPVWKHHPGYVTNRWKSTLPPLFDKRAARLAPAACCTTAFARVRIMSPQFEAVSYSHENLWLP
jgi:hypothetical protein